MKKEIKRIAIGLTIGVIIYPPVQLFGLNMGRKWMSDLIDYNRTDIVQWDRLVIEIIAIWWLAWLVSTILDVQQKNQLLEQAKSGNKRQK